MLSLVPTLTVLSQLLGVLEIPLDFLDDWVKANVLPEMAGSLKEILQDSGKTSAATSNIVMIIMALWARIEAQFSMMRIANYTYTSGRTTGSFWRGKNQITEDHGLDLIYAGLRCYYTCIRKIDFTGRIRSYYRGTMIDTLWTYLRWPIAGTLYFLMVSYNYYVLPNEKLKFRKSYQAVSLARLAC